MLIGVFESCKSKNNLNMDSGPSIKNEESKISNSISDVSDVSESFWLRRDSDYVNQINRFLLWSQFGFVLPCGILLWVVFFIFR